jgi:hypothetical protein
MRNGDLLSTKEFLEIVAHSIAGGCCANATQDEIVASAAHELVDLVLQINAALDPGPLRVIVELMTKAMLAQHIYGVKAIAQSALMDDLSDVPPPDWTSRSN